MPTPKKPVRPVKSKTILDPKVVQANQYDNYNNVPAPVVPIVPPNLGQTSRAYSLTHGSQAGITPGLTQLAGQSGIGSRGGSVPVDTGPGYTPLTPDLTKNPYGPAYDQLLQFVKDSTAARTGQYDATKGQFALQQEQANKQLYDAYQNSRQGADASATALGVDPNVVSATRDLMMRKNQENSDQSLADNLAWLDKGKLLEQSLLGGTANQFAQEKASKVGAWDAGEQKRINDLNIANLAGIVKAATVKSGGGGKGGGGGSSGSSGSTKDAVKETQTLTNSGMDKAAYDEILANYGPEAAATYLNEFNQTQGTPLMKTAQSKINELTPVANWTPGSAGWNIVKKLMDNAKGLNPQSAAKAKNDLAIQQAILKGATGFSGLLGNPKTTSTVTRSGKG